MIDQLLSNTHAGYRETLSRGSPGPLLHYTTLRRSLAKDIYVFVPTWYLRYCYRGVHRQLYDGADQTKLETVVYDLGGGSMYAHARLQPK
jgi:hypothetical protein